MEFRGFILHFPPTQYTVPGEKKQSCLFVAGPKPLILTLSPFRKLAQKPWENNSVRASQGACHRDQTPLGTRSKQVHLCQSRKGQAQNRTNLGRNHATSIRSIFQKTTKLAPVPSAQCSFARFGVQHVENRLHVRATDILDTSQEQAKVKMPLASRRCKNPLLHPQ